MQPSKYPEKERLARAKASREWKRRNREHVQKRLAEWLLKNASRRDEYMKQYRLRTKAHQKIVDAARNLKKRDDPKIKARKKAYMANWLALNRHRHRAAYSKREALKRGNAVGNQKIIADWFRNWRALRRVKCYWCKHPVSPSVCHGDHIIPLAKGGAHTIENLCISCGDCNRHKHDKSLDQWNAELIQPVLL